MKTTLFLISIAISIQFNVFSQNVRDLKGYNISAGQTSGENITYTDLIPDSAFVLGMHHEYKEFGIDVTHDGNADVKFTSEIWWYTQHDFMVTSFIKIVNENISIVVHPVHSTYAFPVDFGEEISQQDSWSNSDSLLLESWSYLNGTYNSIGYLGHGYVGFRINQEEPMYGWINNAGNNDGPGLRVSEHAISGEIINDVADISEKLMVICPNPAQNFVTLKGLDRTGMYKLFNLAGKLMKQGHLAPNESIDLSGIKQGMYLLNFNDNKKVFNFLVEVI